MWEQEVGRLQVSTGWEMLRVCNRWLRWWGDGKMGTGQEFEGLESNWNSRKEREGSKALSV
jgi:hypothetical protein